MVEAEWNLIYWIQYQDEKHEFLEVIILSKIYFK